MASALPLSRFHEAQCFLLLLAQALCFAALVLALIPRHDTSIADSAAEMAWGTDR